MVNLAVGILSVLGGHRTVDDVDRLLDQVSKAYAAVTTAQFDVHFQSTDPHMRRLKGDVKVTILRPNKLRAVITGLSDGTRTVITDGASISTVTARGHKRSPYTLETLSHDLPLNVETFAFTDAKHELSRDKGGAMAGSTLTLTESVWRGKTWIVLEEVNKADDAKDRYFVSKDDHLVWRTVDMSADGETVYSDTEISNLKLGEPVSEEIFRVN